MIDVSQITQLQSDMVTAWHEEDIYNPCHGFMEVVCEQHKFNFLLWHEEDFARSPDATDTEIARVKRAIDGFNQARNDHIEKLDDYLLSLLASQEIAPARTAPLNTETPGSVIDRLSILSLRIFHMREQAERRDVAPAHREKVEEKLVVLHRQLGDLSNSLTELLGDILAGRKRLQVYRQFKMYNDPSLNPYLYNSPRRKAG